PQLTPCPTLRSSDLYCRRRLAPPSLVTPSHSTCVVAPSTADTKTHPSIRGLARNLIRSVGANRPDNDGGARASKGRRSTPYHVSSITSARSGSNHSTAGRECVSVRVKFPETLTAAR